MSAVVALKNIKRNLKLNPKVFQFEVPKDAEIVDLTEEE
jgi:outer membrane lipoprotein-sorting protein